MNTATLDELCTTGSFTPLVRDFAKVAVLGKRNIVVAGSAGAGKTTLLAALCNEIPSHERLVTIETATELRLRSHHHPNVVSLVAVAGQLNIEGVDPNTAADTAKLALRLEPDRVIVGDTTENECDAIISAMRLHDGSMCTVNAMPGQALERLRKLLSSSYPQASPVMLTGIITEAVHFVFHVAVLPNGDRRLISIRETAGPGGGNFVSNEVFRWDPASRSLMPTGTLSETHRTLLSDLGFPVTQLVGPRR
jgi:pilus assembly protein CpaF